MPGDFTDPTSSIPGVTTALGGLGTVAAEAASSADVLSGSLSTLVRLFGGAGLGAQVGKMAVSLYDLTRPLKANADEAEKAAHKLKNLQTQLSFAGAAAGFLLQRLAELRHNVDQTSASVAKINAHFGNGRIAASEYLDTVQKVRSAYGKAGEAAAKQLIPQLAQMGMEAGTVGKDIQQMSAYMIAGGTNARAFSSSFETLYRSLVGSGTQADRSGRAMDSFAKIGGLAQETGEPIDDMASAIVRLAESGRQFGWSADGMTRAMSQWHDAMKQSKVDVAEVADFLRTAMDATRPENAMSQLPALLMGARQFGQMKPEQQKALNMAAQAVGEKDFAAIARSPRKLLGFQQRAEDLGVAEELQAMKQTTIGGKSGAYGTYGVESLALAPTLGLKHSANRASESLGSQSDLSAGARKYAGKVDTEAGNAQEIWDRALTKVKGAGLFVEKAAADLQQNHPMLSMGVHAVAQAAIIGGGMALGGSIMGKMGGLGGIAGKVAGAGGAVLGKTPLPVYVTNMSGGSFEGGGGGMPDIKKAAGFFSMSARVVPAIAVGLAIGTAVAAGITVVGKSMADKTVKDAQKRDKAFETQLAARNGIDPASGDVVGQLYRRGQAAKAAREAAAKDQFQEAQKERARETKIVVQLDTSPEFQARIDTGMKNTADAVAVEQMTRASKRSFGNT